MKNLFKVRKKIEAFAQNYVIVAVVCPFFVGVF